MVAKLTAGQQKTAQLAKDIKHFDFTGLKTDCLSCHKDFHKFGPLAMKSLGPLNRCATCHNEKSWKEIARFDHNQSTRYVLDGKHLDLKCAECHIPEKMHLKVGIYRWPQLTIKGCETCHKSPHRNEFSPALLKKACTECHTTNDWQEMKNGKGFDHSKTRFALTGAHQRTRCTDCHGQRPKQVFKFKSFAQKFCVDCHQNIHRDQFSKKFASDDCTRCHTTKNFTERANFDHSLTRYPLEGAHREVKCADCHKPIEGKFVDYKNQRTPVIRYKPLGRECLDCHKDVHGGQLEAKCASCHSSEGWKELRFDHQTQSSFELRGKHKTAKCSECHKPIAGQFVALKTMNLPVIRYKPLTKACADCHKDPHKGGFGNHCQECHTERDWKITKDFHKNFTLTGVHYSLNCAECHQEGRKLSGLSQECFACHAKDDVHSGTLPHCQECHRQNFWEISSFRHSMTRFPLRGAHRTIDCMDCHKNGTYQGLSSQCVTCHLQDQMSASFDHSKVTNPLDCARCHHNSFSWR